MNKLKRISAKSKRSLLFPETVIVFLFQKLNLYLQYLFFLFGTNLSFIILSQKLVEQKHFIKLTINHFKQNGHKKEKNNFWEDISH